MLFLLLLQTAQRDTEHKRRTWLSLIWKSLFLHLVLTHQFVSCTPSVQSSLRSQQSFGIQKHPTSSLEPASSIPCSQHHVTGSSPDTGLVHSTWCVQVLRSPKEAFAAAMQSWRERCEKCVCLQGDYIEK